MKKEKSNVTKDIKDMNEEIIKLAEAATTARGCVVFVGRISDITDENGNFLTNFTYLRKNYPIEDLKKAHRAFLEHVQKDALKLVE